LKRTQLFFSRVFEISPSQETPKNALKKKIRSTYVLFFASWRRCTSFSRFIFSAAPCRSSRCAIDYRPQSPERFPSPSVGRPHLHHRRTKRRFLYPLHARWFCWLPHAASVAPCPNTLQHLPLPRQFQSPGGTTEENLPRLQQVNHDARRQSGPHYFD
jgi:hypothetical protein